MIEIDCEKLTFARANAGLTLEELARKAGVKSNSIWRIENQKVNPRLCTVGKIAKALGKRIEDFRKEG